jgi:predicted ATPase
MISRLCLKNFKCFEVLNIEMSFLNVLTGINSTGKSTAIQALLLLRQAYEMGAISEGIYLNGDLTNIGIGQDLLCKSSTSDTIEISLGMGGYKLNWSYEYSSKGNYLKILDTSMSQTGTCGVNLFSPTFAYVSAERMGPQRIYGKSLHQVQEKNQIGYRGEFFADYLAERGLSDKVENTHVFFNGYNSKLQYQMGAWLSVISPGITGVETIPFPEAGIVQVGYNTVVGRTAVTHSPLNVGFGLSYTAPVILALLKAKKGDLVVLENPEAHLHPKGQRVLGGLIAKAAMGGVQIIVETHSDHLLNGIRLAVRKKDLDQSYVRINYFFTEERDKNLIHTKTSPAVLEDGSLSDWPEGFFDEWDKAIMELF